MLRQPNVLLSKQLEKVDFARTKVDTVGKEGGMSLFTGKLLKFFAMLVAVMTVTISQPVVGCVCPNGQVKLFCSGPSPARCCCPVPVSKVPVKPDCDKSNGHLSSCCQRHLGEFSTAKHICAEVKSPCCHRTVLVDAAAFTAKVFGDGDDTVGSADSLAEWATAYPILRSTFVSLAKRPTVGPLPPPDLIITHCHFTC